MDEEAPQTTTDGASSPPPSSSVAAEVASTLSASDFVDLEDASTEIPQPQSVPLISEATSEWITNSMEWKQMGEDRKELVRGCLELMAKELFYWKEFPIHLPPTRFASTIGKEGDEDGDDGPRRTFEKKAAAELQIIEEEEAQGKTSQDNSSFFSSQNNEWRWQSFLDGLLQSSHSALNMNLFQPTPNFDELTELAFEEDGRNRRRPTKEQLEQIWRTSRFIVPSHRFTGKQHVWQVSWLLIKGRENIRKDFRQSISNALYHLMCMPDCIWAPSASIRSGIVECYNVVGDILRTTIGLPEYRSRYSPGEVQTELLRQCKLYSLLPWKAAAEAVMKEEREDESLRLDVKREVLTPTGPASIDKGKSKADQEDPVEDELIAIDFRVYDTGFMSQVEPILQRIFGEESEAWRIARIDYAASLAKQVHAELKQSSTEQDDSSTSSSSETGEDDSKVKGKEKLSDSQRSSEDDRYDEDESNEDEQADHDKTEAEILDQVAKRVRALCTEEENRRMLEAIRNSAELDSVSPGLASAIADKLQAILIVRTVAFHYGQMRARKRSNIESEIIAAHPYLSLQQHWLNEKVEARMKKWRAETKYDDWLEAIFKLEVAGLDTFAFLMKREMEWMQHNHASEKARLSAMKEVAAELTWYRMIWRSRNWIIERQTNWSTAMYTATKYHEVKVSTGVVGWRLLAIWVRSLTWLNNFLLFSYDNIWNGSLGIRTLFKRQPFNPYETVDHLTGQIIVDTSITIPTLWSRLDDIWADVRRSRMQFEAAPDTGFLGKGVTRIFNIVWNHFFKGTIGSLVVGLCLPVVVAVNVTITAALMATAIIWVPASSLATSLFNLTIFDIDKSYNGVRILPAFYYLFRIGIHGVGRIGLSILNLLALHPIMAAANSLWGCLRTTMRSTHDWIMYHLVVKTRGRIPVHDTFIARRVEGPGLSSTFYLQAKTEDVLTALQLQLEQEELDLFETATRALIDQPLTRYQEFIKDVMGPFLMNYTARHPFLERSTDRYKKRLMRLVVMRKKLLPQIDWSQRNMIRLNQQDLAETLQRSEDLVKEFVTTHVFAKIFHNDEAKVREYWTNKQLVQGDWNGLARKILSNTFSSHFLMPLTDSDTSVRLETVHAASLRPFASMIKRGVPRDDLDQVLVHIDLNSSSSIDLPTITRTDLTAYYYGCGTLKQLEGACCPHTIGYNVLFDSRVQFPL